MSRQVAIIGIAGIFPQARTIGEFWHNIVNKVDCITDVPPSRWSIDDYYDPDPQTPDKTYSKRGGFIPDVDFDPLDFGLPPNILEVTDVSQLLSLIVAKEAMSDAGYDRAEESVRQRTGVILGVGGGQKLITPLTSRLQYPIWEKVLKNAGLSDRDTKKIIDKIKLAYIPWEENSFPGMLGNVIAGRIANRLDLGGINCVVDAACASSLTAVRMAVSELTENRSDLMITGGVDTDNSIFMYLSFSKTPAFSRQQQIRPFDAAADGMIIGEGIGMMVLKRLEDAQRDGDRIYAIIQGIGAASDGKYKSIYAPCESGQALALNRAYEDAGFNPSTVGLIEAHGTGTNAGDPTEFAALNRVFSQDNVQKQYIALGSVKSQIGHTKSTAGAASLIKAALALHHQILPPTINVSKPHPSLKIEGSPFYLNTETRPWIRSADSHPRRAGVSSFGFGGTNYHVVLEEYIPEHQQAYRLHSTPETMIIFAPTQEQLIVKCQEFLAKLRSDSGENFYSEIVKFARTRSIPTRAARVGFLSTSSSNAEQLLQLTIDTLIRDSHRKDWEHPQGIYYRQQGIKAEGKVVALFPGQGSQYLEMGKELVLNFPELRQVYGEIDGLFLAEGKEPISSKVFPHPVFTEADRVTLTETLKQTENAQPAIGVSSMGLFKILERANFKPDFMIGHSFGELSALWASGVLTDRDYLFLVKARGQAMASSRESNIDRGTMIAVKGDIDRIASIVDDFPQITIANWNSQEQLVLAGRSADIANIQVKLEGDGYKVINLPVSAAFHTDLVRSAQIPFAKAVRSVTLNSPKIPVYANTTAGLYPQTTDAIAQLLIDQIVHPVRFKQQIENVYGAGGYFFIEIGPQSILTNLVKNILADKPHLAIALDLSRERDSDRSLRSAVLQLRIAGLNLTDIDPYQVESKPIASSNKSKLTIALNGSNYVSPKTQAAFAEALEDREPIVVPISIDTNYVDTTIERQKLETMEENYRQNIPAATIIDPIEQLQPLLSNIINTREPNSMNQSNGHYPENSTSFERLMKEFYAHQSEVLRVHEQYLKSQEDAARNFFQIMQQQLLQGTGEKMLPVRNGSESQLGSLTLTPDRVNDTVVSVNAIEAPSISHLNSVESTPVIPSSPPIDEPSNLDIALMSKSLLEVVSDKTGYPVEMLELEMDMEADLGIDSIKRVEILGEMQNIFSDLPPVKPNELAELRTLQQIVEYMVQQGKQKKTIGVS
jgi:polyketide-type polyunsaturated fatty acid synthase PfaA